MNKLNTNPKTNPNLTPFPNPKIIRLDTEIYFQKPTNMPSNGNGIFGPQVNSTSFFACWSTLHHFGPVNIMQSIINVYICTSHDTRWTCHDRVV